MLQESVKIISLLVNSIKLVQAISNDKKQLERRYNSIIEELKGHGLSLDRIEKKIDDQILRKVLKATICLEDAIKILSNQARENSLRIAYDGFTELLTLDPKQDTIGTTVSVSNTKLIGLGYAGRFIYYCITNSYKYALVQVYTCTERFPIVGTELFGDSFFSQNYKNLIQELDKKISTVTNSLHKEENLMPSGLPANQLLPLLEMERELLIDTIVHESKIFQQYINNQSASLFLE